MIYIQRYILEAFIKCKWYFKGTVFDYADVTTFSIINDKFTRFHKHAGLQQVVQNVSF